MYWPPTFLTAAKGLTEAQADAPLARDLPGAAVLGTAAAAWLADRFTTGNPRLLFFLPGLAMLAAIPCTLAAIYGRGMSWIFGGCSWPRARCS